jgi:hypothetical protein
METKGEKNTSTTAASLHFASMARKAAVAAAKGISKGATAADEAAKAQKDTGI